MVRRKDRVTGTADYVSYLMLAGFGIANSQETVVREGISYEGLVTCEDGCVQKDETEEG